ncbi:MAG: hypothetical protein ACLUFP_05735 [Streptococcus salivarius]
MACSKPVVGYRHGGSLVKWLRKVKTVFLPHQISLQNCLRVIQELADNTEKREQFGKASVKRQKNSFSLQSYIRNFSELYKK